MTAALLGKPIVDQLSCSLLALPHDKEWIPPRLKKDNRNYAYQILITYNLETISGTIHRIESSFAIRI
jgi:hypothetical protein